MSDGRFSDTATWFADPSQLVTELKQGEFAPRRAPALDGFEELHEIGRGGQAVVYTGIQRSTKRRAAIKVLLDGAFASEVNRRRFEREIELVASLRHPHIVDVYDSGQSADGHPFCVMEYIEGVPLDEYAATWNLPERTDGKYREYLELFAATCEAVNYAHQRGVIHRDLKPSNIRIDKEGQPHILDFGLAKFSRESDVRTSRTGMSVTGQFLGSLAWASPEQAKGDPSLVDIRSDVYSLGVILYQGLTGHFPHNISSGIHAVLDSILNSEPIRPRVLNSHIDEELETIIQKCLAKEPDRRYQTAGELAVDIRRYLAGEPILAKGDSTWYTLRKTARRYRTAVIFSCVFALAVTCFAITMAFLYGRASRAETTARQEAARASAVNAFLENMLSSVSPDEKGRDISVRAVLDEASVQIQRDLTNEPLVQASLHNIIGSTYQSLGDYSKARSHFEDAITIFKEKFGENSVHTIETQNALGELLIDQNKLDEAEQLMTATLAKAAGLAPKDQRASLHAQTNLGRLRGNQARWDEAEKILKPVAEEMGRVLGPTDRETLATLNNLATIYHSQAKYAEAEAIHRRLLAARVAAYGKDHPLTLLSMSNLATVLNSLGKLSEAETLLREQIVGAMHAWGAEHRSTLAAQANLSFCLFQQNKNEEALQLTLQILPILKRVLGPTHANTIAAMNALSALYTQMKRYSEAERVGKEAYDTCRSALGEKSLESLTAMHNLASAYLCQNRLDEAEKLFSKELPLCKTVYGPDHPDLAWTMNQLATLWIKQGKPNEAADLLAEAIRIVRKGLPPNHYFLPWLLYNRTDALIASKRYEEAEKDGLEAYGLYRTKGGDKDSDTQDTIREMIKLYEAWGKTKEANQFRGLRIERSTGQPASAPAH